MRGGCNENTGGTAEELLPIYNFRLLLARSADPEQLLVDVRHMRTAQRFDLSYRCFGALVLHG